MYREFIKPVIDFILALIILVIASPVFFMTAILLFIQNNGKVFFYQERPGKGKKAFTIIKFKTMSDRKAEDGSLLPDKHRITQIGSWVRKLSIDELPQLINVIKGDMSLIGPRPLLFKYVPLYSKEQDRRHEVKPGITGWAQVNGRNAISWTRKFELDVYYVDHLSFGLDARILWMTFLKVIKREGVNQSEERPMMPFDGTN